MRFSVIIVNYDSWPHTVGCVESLHATGYRDFEVVVVDNDQRPVPVSLPPLRLFRNPQNAGLTRAWNRAIAATSGEHVILLNPDTRVERDFFERLEEFFRANPRAGISGPKVVGREGDVQLSARREISFVSGLLGRTSLMTRLFWRSAAVRRMFPAANNPSTPTEVDWVSGACLAVRRETLEELSPLDERFFLYFEDVDLCRRAREAGWLVYYLPHVEIFHYTGASSRSRPWAVWQLHRSAFLYHRKYGPRGPLNLYSALILLGLGARALAKLAVGLSGDLAERIGGRRLC